MTFGSLANLADVVTHTGTTSATLAAFISPAIARRYGPRTKRPTDETAPGRYGPLQDDTDRGHRGAYPSTATVPPQCLASLVVAAALAVTDTYDGYERCSLTDLMDMYTCMSDNSYQYHTVVLVTIIIYLGISNWSVSSVPAVRIVRAVWVMGRIVWTPLQQMLSLWFPGGRFHFHGRHFELCSGRFEFALCGRRFYQDALSLSLMNPILFGAHWHCLTCTNRSLTKTNHINILPTEAGMVQHIAGETSDKIEVPCAPDKIPYKQDHGVHLDVPRCTTKHRPNVVVLEEIDEHMLLVRPSMFFDKVVVILESDWLKLHPLYGLILQIKGEFHFVDRKE